MFWNIPRHRLLYHPLCLRKMCLPPHHQGLHLCQSPLKRRRFNNLLHLTLMCNLTAMGLSGTRDTVDTPVTIPQQVPLPPIQVSPSREETNMSTGDSIVPPPLWFDETPQPSSTIHEDVLPPAPSFDETPFGQLHFLKLRRFHLWQSVGDLVRFIRFQKLRRFLLWQNVGDLEHFISRILYRSVGDPIPCIPGLMFRPQRLHSFGGAPVFCVPCVHFEDSETHNQISRNV